MQDLSLSRILKQAQIPGASIAIIRKDEKIITEIAGIADAKTNEKVTLDTVFEAASLTKPFFAYIILKMIQQSLFSRTGQSAESGLDRSLASITFEFGPPPLRKHSYQRLLTVRRILSHQAGLPNWFPITYTSKPGTSFDYSGLAFCSLNDVAETITKKTLDQLASETFQQLGMTHSSMIEPNRYARGYFNNGKPDDRKHFFRSNPAASLFTTAEDYAKFLQACLQDNFIRKHLFQPQIQLTDKDHKAQQAQVTKSTLDQIYWGLGFGLQVTKAGGMIAFHWGESDSYRAFTAINLRSSQAVVCFTNSGNGSRIFKMLSEPVVGNLNPVWQWLSRREELDLQPPQNLTSVLQQHFSLFKKMEKNYLMDHRYDDPKLQREYDRQFGLVPLSHFFVVI